MRAKDSGGGGGGFGGGVQTVMLVWEEFLSESNGEVRQGLDENFWQRIRPLSRTRPG